MTKSSALLLTIALSAFPTAAFAQQPFTATFTEAGKGAANVGPASIDARDLEKRLFGAKRSPLLLSLSGSLIALNVLDVVTTRRALAQGAVEANPFM